MKVNLLKERNQAYSINWMEIVIIISVVLFIVAMGAYYYYLYAQSVELNGNIKSLDNQINTLIVRVGEYNRLKSRVEELEEIKAKMDALQYVWDDALLEMGYVIPSQTLISNLEIQEKQLSMYGRAIENQKVLDLIDNMKLSPVYDNVKLLNISYTSDTDYNLEAVIVTEEGDE